MYINDSCRVQHKYTVLGNVEAIYFHPISYHLHFKRRDSKINVRNETHLLSIVIDDGGYSDEARRTFRKEM